MQSVSEVGDRRPSSEFAPSPEVLSRNPSSNPDRGLWPGPARPHSAADRRRSTLPRTILLVHDGHGPLRGSEAVAFSLFDGIDRQRYRWVVLTNHAEFAAGCRERGIFAEFLAFRMLFTKGFCLHDLIDLVRFSALGVRVIRREKISLVHLSNGGSCSWMAPSAWLCRVPTLVHVHAHWSRKMRFILGLHLADVIVGVSKSVLAGFQRDLVPAGRLKVIYSGLDRLAGMPQDRQAARAKFVDDPKDVVIAVVAALVDVKRVDIAIEAVRLLPSDLISQTRLLIIGDGLDRATLEKRAEGLRVTFTGHRNDVHELLLNVVEVGLHVGNHAAQPLGQGSHMKTGF